MDPHEREVIDGIFNRLKDVENAPRDPEAERHIAELVARQPYAPYALAQAVYVQDMAVQQLTRRNEELETRVRQLEDELRQAREQQPTAAPQSGQPGGFLSGLFGGGRTSVPPVGRSAAGSAQGAAAPQQGPFARGPAAGGAPGGPWSRGPQQPAGPWGGQPQAAPQPPAGGGFLRSALATAAGVAGGALLFDAVKGMMGGSSAASATPLAQPQTAADAARDAGATGDVQPAASDQGDAAVQTAGHADPGQDGWSNDTGGWDNAGWDDGGAWDDGGGWDGGDGGDWV
ncbi:DUF2076 domain-containing protein [Camelimonas abortus]|uniref:DUF2076 domain-containing protein n=1 Tax=Camelimonas abortus TaxID=1017184 RepID=UPI0035E6D08E